MDRLACVDVFSFPLQILLSTNPEWLDHPVAVLERAHPQGRLTFLNRHAKEARLSRGMRYGEALALVPHLRADAVEESLLTNRAEAIAATLKRYSPHVEWDQTRPGVFWLDASGLSRLYPDWRHWVEPMRESLKSEHDAFCTVVVGFRRFHTFAIARAFGRSGIFADGEAEERAASAIALSALDLSPKTEQKLARLGLSTIKDLLALPAEGLRRRLGSEVFALHQLATGTLEKPFAAFRQDQAPGKSEQLDYAENDAHRLLFLIKRSLHPLLETLKGRGERLTRLEILLHRRREPALPADVRPATPTTDALLILELVRLRLENLPLGTGITEIDLTAQGERTSAGQLQLFASAPSRDVEAANRALARLRAEFGDDTVLQVCLTEAHLPELRFALQPLQKIALPQPPQPPQSTAHPAVRRFFPAPLRLPRPPKSPTRAGPHTICGGWWVRQVHRDYYLLQTPDHRLLWLFYDHVRSHWYVHAEF